MMTNPKELVALKRTYRDGKVTYQFQYRFLAELAIHCIPTSELAVERAKIITSEDTNEWYAAQQDHHMGSDNIQILLHLAETYPDSSTSVH